MAQSIALEVANDIFGSDSDSDDGIDGGVSSESSSMKSVAALFDENGKRKLMHPSAVLKLWKNEADAALFPPKYVGPVVLEQGFSSDEIGGCRGFVAAEDIPPGTLLLSEYPVMLWNKDLGIKDGSGAEGVPFEVRVIQKILQREDAERVIQSMAPLYPEVLSEYADESVVEAFRGDLSFVRLINDLPTKYVSLSFDEALRIVLALRSNAFASGLYPHFAMFNHSCMPNCVKYPPLNKELASEVRAISHVKKGEALTVSYLEPRETSRLERKTQLWGQFRFHCRCELCAGLSHVSPDSADKDSSITSIRLEEGKDNIFTKPWWWACEVNLLGVLALRHLVSLAGKDPRLYKNKNELQVAASEVREFLILNELQTVSEAEEAVNSPDEVKTLGKSENKVTFKTLDRQVAESAEVEVFDKRLLDMISSDSNNLKEGFHEEEAALAERSVSEKVEADYYVELEDFEQSFQTLLNEGSENNQSSRLNLTSSLEKKNQVATAVAHVSRARGLRASALWHLQPGHPFHQRCLKYTIDVFAHATTLLEEEYYHRFRKSGRGSAAAGVASNDERNESERVEDDNDGSKENSNEKKQLQRLIVMVQEMLMMSLELKDIQIHFLGTDHPDLGRTHQDISNCLRLLLKIAPRCFKETADTKTLEQKASTSLSCISKFKSPRMEDVTIHTFPPPNLVSVSMANQSELKERMSYERIRSLYSGY